MDFVVRYWNDVKNKVSLRYLNSKFLGHAEALDIIHELNKGIKELNKRQLLQISIDGPSVNWAFSKKYKYTVSKKNCHN